MGRATPHGPLEFEDDPEPSDRLHAFLHGLRIRGHSPYELEYGAPRVKAYDDQGNQASLEDAVDQLEEARDVALLHSAKYQQALRRYHHRHVRGRAFNIGDLVLRLR
jgi:hypothetical protein